jgi:hypothetical protein
VVTVAGQSGEAGRDHRSFIDRRVVDLLEVAQQPSRRDARMPAWSLTRYQHRQVERADEAERR